MTGSTFKKILTNPVQANGSLEGTMSGQDIGAPNTNPNDPQMGQFDQNIDAAYEKLNSILTSMPGVDYESKFGDILNEIQNRPTSENPLSTPGGVASSFAFALGSPDKAPALIHEKIQRSEMENDQKKNDLLNLKEKILQGTIQEEVAKGNFKAALKQTEALDQIQRAKEDKKRAQDMRDWKEKQRIKTVDSGKLIRAKADNIVASFHLPEKAKLKVIDFITSSFKERQRQRNLLGEPIEDMSSEDIMDDITPDLDDFVKKLLSGEETRPEDKPADTPAPKSKYAEALERIRAGKK